MKARTYIRGGYSKGHVSTDGGELFGAITLSRLPVLGNEASTLSSN